MSEKRPAAAEYLAFLRRRKWLIILTVLVTTASAFAFSARQHKLYTAKSQVLLSQQSTLSSNVTGNSSPSGTADATRYDLTQAELAHTPGVAAEALTGSTLLKDPANVANYTAAKLLSQSTVSADPSSDIVTFAVTNPSPAIATTLVNAYASAYVAYRNNLDVNGAKKALAQLQTKIAALQKQIDTDKKANVATTGLATQLEKLVGKETALSTAITLQSTDASASVSKLASGAQQTSPNVKKNVILGALLGLVLGVVFALLREAFDTKVRSSDEISEKIGLQLLARIPTPPRALRNKHQLAMLEGDETHSEPYRALRVSFDFANLDKQARTVMVTSALEREGKSTTAANLAVALAQTGRTVALVDLDLRRPFLETFFGLQGRPGVTDVALGGVPLNEALCPVVVTDPNQAPYTAAGNGNGNGNGHSAGSGVLKVLPAGALPPRPSEFLASEALANVLSELVSGSSVVIVDAPPLLPVSDASTLSGVVDGMFLVVSAAQVKADVLKELERVVSALPSEKLGYVLTAADSEGGSGYGYHGYGSYRSYNVKNRDPAGHSSPAVSARD